MCNSKFFSYLILKCERQFIIEILFYAENVNEWFSICMHVWNTYPDLVSHNMYNKHKTCLQVANKLADTETLNSAVVYLPPSRHTNYKYSELFLQRRV